MRRGFILAVLGLGALVLVIAKVFSPSKAVTPHEADVFSATSERVPTLVIPAAGKSNQVRGSRMTSGDGRPSPDAKVQNPANGESVRRLSADPSEREARVAARVIELGELSRSTDRASLETLLSEVRNPDREIRQAALDAITQSGNRAAIPGLREAAGQTRDPQDKEAIEEVIEFMSLPTLTEVLRGQTATNSPRAPIE